jgi:hypothetical protein
MDRLAITSDFLDHRLEAPSTYHLNTIKNGVFAGMWIDEEINHIRESVGMKFQTVVYIMRQKWNSGSIKIGHTSIPLSRRLNQLKSSHKMSVVTTAFIHDFFRHKNSTNMLRNLEYYLHDQFATERDIDLKGRECFKVHPQEVVDFATKELGAKVLINVEMSSEGPLFE